MKNIGSGKSRKMHSKRATKRVETLNFEIQATTEPSTPIHQKTKQYRINEKYHKRIEDYNAYVIKAGKSHSSIRNSK